MHNKLGWPNARPYPTASGAPHAQLFVVMVVVVGVVVVVVVVGVVAVTLTHTHGLKSGTFSARGLKTDSYTQHLAKMSFDEIFKSSISQLECILIFL